jgi:hypothetical protein
VYQTPATGPPAGPESSVIAALSWAAAGDTTPPFEAMISRMPS